MTRRLLAPLGLAAVCALTCQPPPQARRPAAAQPAAFVTLFSGGDFLPGVQLLWYSLHRTSTAFPLLVMYTDEVDARALLAFARRVPGGTLETARVAAIANPYLRANSTNRYANVAAKLRVWQQRRYGVAVSEYLAARSVAGCTGENIVGGCDELTRGRVRSRFFAFFPPRRVDLHAWLGAWLGQGCSAVATLNTQLM